MAKYGKAASKNVKSTMRRRKKGTLKSGSGRTVKSRKQAIAIALNEARKKGAEGPSQSLRRPRAREREAELDRCSTILAAAARRTGADTAGR